MNVKCLACGKSFSVRNALLGEKTFCVFCGKLLKMVREGPPKVATVEVKTNEPQKTRPKHISAPQDAVARTKEKTTRGSSFAGGKFWLRFLMSLTAMATGVVALAVTIMGLYAILSQPAIAYMSGGDVLIIGFLVALSVALWWLAAGALGVARNPSLTTKIKPRR